MDKVKITEFFNELAPVWDANAQSNPAVTNTILDYAGITKDVSVLDVGCGTGVLFPYYLEREVASITGIDISDEMIAVAVKKFNHPRVSFIHADAETACFDCLYDCCVIYNAFPHFPNPEALIQNLSTSVKKGGILTIAHGGSREHIDSHHMQHAQEVSVMLMSDSDIAELMSDYFEVIVTVSDEYMHQIVGVRK